MSINNGLTTEQVEQRRSDVRRVTGFALTLDPFDVFNATNNNTVPAEQFPPIQAKYIVELFNEDQKRPVSMSIGGAFFGAAMGQSWMIMHKALEHDPRDLSIQDAVAMGRDERTLYAHALMASQSDGMSDVMVQNLHGAFYRITAEGDAIEVSPGIEPAALATCPEAGPYGKVEPTPLMRRFVPWATELAVYSILRSKIGRDQPAAAGDEESLPLMLAK